MIHSATGGMGQAIIQMSRILGISDIFVTVGTAEKKSFLMERYGISENHIFSSRDVGFSRAILRLRPAGVEIVVNSLSGHVRTASWDGVAFYGHFVGLGIVDTKSKDLVSMRTTLSNISFSTVNMERLMCERRELLSK